MPLVSRKLRQGMLKIFIFFLILKLNISFFFNNNILIKDIQYTNTQHFRIVKNTETKKWPDFEEISHDLKFYGRLKISKTTNY